MPRSPHLEGTKGGPFLLGGLFRFIFVARDGQRTGAGLDGLNMLNIFQHSHGEETSGFGEANLSVLCGDVERENIWSSVS